MGAGYRYGQRTMNGLATPAFAPLAADEHDGRRFEGSRKVRLGDVTPDGRLRLDSLTRYTQDVSDDDTVDAGLDVEPGWVVRSTVVDELIPAALAEVLTITTFCSALGKRWAERRLSVVGDAGARYEVATLWVCMDPHSSRPVALTPQFLALYGSAAGDRRVRARLQVPKSTDLNPGRIEDDRWPLRVADFDVFGHVNNAAYWSAIEQWPETLPAWPRRARLEYREEVTSQEVMITRASVGADVYFWWSQGQAVAAAASVAKLPDGLYEPA